MTHRLVIAAVAALLVHAAPAFAQSAPERGLEACATEVAALCQSIEPGRGRTLSCLQESKARLGSACAAAVEVRAVERSTREARMAACRDDADSLCQNVERGGGRRTACLKDNQAKLSPGCASALSSVK